MMRFTGINNRVHEASSLLFSQLVIRNPEIWNWKFSRQESGSGVRSQDSGQDRSSSPNESNCWLPLFSLLPPRSFIYCSVGKLLGHLNSNWNWNKWNEFLIIFSPLQHPCTSWKAKQAEKLIWPKYLTICVIVLHGWLYLISKPSE
jgi:hypothetical protein